MSDEYLFKQMADPTPSELSVEQRLAELYAVMRRIACGSGKPGDRPLAGGVQTFVKGVLKRHGVATDLKPYQACPYCGRTEPCGVAEESQPSQEGLQEVTDPFTAGS